VYARTTRTSVRDISMMGGSTAISRLRRLESNREGKKRGGVNLLKKKKGEKKSLPCLPKGEQNAVPSYELSGRRSRKKELHAPLRNGEGNIFSIESLEGSDPLVKWT